MKYDPVLLLLSPGWKLVIILKFPQGVNQKILLTPKNTAWNKYVLKGRNVADWKRNRYHVV